MTDTIVRAATHGKGRRALDRVLNMRQSFTTSGALKGEAGSICAFRFRGEGELRGADKDRWKADRERVTFVVTSYSTPIGWVVYDGTPRGEFYRVTQKFSVTTSKHQGTLYAVEMPAGHFDSWI